MDRREWLKGACALACTLSGAPLRAQSVTSPLPLAPAASRVRPGQGGWPVASEWAQLKQRVGGRLVPLASPLEACRSEPEGSACAELFRELKNPYYIGDDPALTQTCGWIDAWTAAPSVYSVAAESASDVAGAVNFARAHHLRLVVRGGGHSYLGTSNAPDSLQVFTRRMNGIRLHEIFVPMSCAGFVTPQPAVSIGAGAIWMHAYDAVTTKGGRIVQGGGCGTVGVAGLVQGGGFGTYSKSFGTAGANLLEAEIVTADGKPRIVNARRDPDLFWALKGGGAGTFGVVTRVTLRTHELPASVGIVSVSLRAKSDDEYRELLARFLAFYADKLLDSHWGENATLRRGNRLDIGLEFIGLDEQAVRESWKPFLEWVQASPGIVVASPPVIASAPARSRWDPQLFRARIPDAIRQDDRPGASGDNFFWSANLAEAGHFLTGFESLWLPASLLREENRARLVDALFAASRSWSVELHLQKGLAGGSPHALAATRDTPMNPAVLDAFCLAIIAGESPPAFPGLAGHAPDMERTRGDARSIAAAMRALRVAVPDGGAYVAESSYFQADWQAAYWGPHYARLLGIKRRYDPAGLFFARHGVGSEEWSEDGFTHLARTQRGRA
jgi:FAD/FMN-containing dehydrogenase